MAMLAQSDSCLGGMGEAARTGGSMTPFLLLHSALFFPRARCDGGSQSPALICLGAAYFLLQHENAFKTIRLFFTAETGLCQNT